MPCLLQGFIPRNLLRLRPLARQSPVFMRVRRTAPMSTFHLLERFVNGKYAISTDIYRFSSDLFCFEPFFIGFCPL